MKVSLMWMKQVVGDNDLPLDAQDIVERIGAQLGAVEEVLDLKPIYSDAVIVKVVSASELTGSDHLKVCLIDDGGVVKQTERAEKKLIRVVCGANNVSAGQLVVWLPPGSIVPASYQKDSLTLEAREIMGVVSNGMLASAKELAIGEDHSGIVVLGEDATVGQLLLDYLNLDDKVIDIENKMFTHRPDLFGQLGVARELCGIYDRQFISPPWYDETREIKPDLSGRLKITNEIHDKGCPRFMAVSIGNLKVGPSPLWMQSYLARTGIRPINNLVDITNYVMMVTGQPLHAYDLDKVGSGGNAELIVRLAKSKEQLGLLDGSVVDLLPDDVVIANSKYAIGLGGIMGGRDSEVSEATSSIILECANFDMFSIRRSSMAHGVFSEAVTRFIKGQSPWQCPAVLAYAIDVLKEIIPDAVIISEVADSLSQKLTQPGSVSVSLKLLNSYLGMELSGHDVIPLLTNVELKPRIEQEQLVVTPPFWRTDIVSAEDIIEEVARLKGFDRLPLGLPKRRLAPPDIPDLIKTKSDIRRLLTAAGASELLNYSFIDEQLMKQTGQEVERSFKLSNALSPEFSYYRGNLMPSLLKAVHANHKAGYDRFALFEIGMGHFSDLLDGEGLPLELKCLALVVSAEDKTVREIYQGPAFYQARHFLDYLLGGLGLNLGDLNFVPPEQLDAERWLLGTYLPGRSAVIRLGEERLGLIGEFNKLAARSLKLPEFCAGFELDLEILSQKLKNQPSTYRPLSRFPKVIQDLTLSLPAEMVYAAVYERLNAGLKPLLAKDMSASLSLIDIYRPEDSATANWTFRLEVDSFSRTLTDQEVNKLIEELKLADF